MIRFLVLCVLVSCVLAQNGYNYEQPQNPLAPQPSGSTPNRQTSGNKSQGNNGGGGGEEHHHSSDDPLQWLRDSVPGEPGVDYPILSKMPETSFTCDDKVPGYYADVEGQCQPFHVCNEMLGGEMMKISFLCPNGTIFNQEGFACQWWNQVDCAASEQFYNKNEEIGKVPENAGQSNSAAASSSQQRPQGSQSRPQNSYQQPSQPQQQQQQQRPRPQNNFQQQQSRPQNNFQSQQSRPQPQRRPQRPNNNNNNNNGYVPPAQSKPQAQITPPPALYGLPRN